MSRVVLVYGMRCDRSVAREETRCSWCAYPIMPFDNQCALRVDGQPLGVITCSLRCALADARKNRRGTLVVRYAEAAA